MKFPRRVSNSLTLKLVALVGIFTALPIVIYGRFEGADRQMRDLVTRAIQHRSWLVAQALTPLMTGNVPLASLSHALDKFSDDGTTLQLMFQPAAGASGGNFYFVASSPPVPPEGAEGTLDSLAAQGILAKLSESCAWSDPVEIRYVAKDSKEQILTSIIPVKNPIGCWVVISSHTADTYLDTSIGRPYWQTHEVRAAAAIYLGMAALVILLTVSVWRSVRRFRGAARQAWQGRIEENSFSDRNVIPELASVAADFDRLVFELHHSAENIREIAENNAHAFKSPVATIQSSLEILKRNLPLDGERTGRAATLIQSSLNRLNALISVAQKLDYNAADLLERPRSRLDLAKLVDELTTEYRPSLSMREIELALYSETGTMVAAGRSTIETAIENILDNAVSFSPRNSTLTVRLFRSTATVELFVEDEGPGIDGAMIDRIFERHVSLRDERADASEQDSDAPAAHAGLGLWIARQNVEALGGTLTAANRAGTGLSVRIALPAA